jgi:hypothetical protein
VELRASKAIELPLQWSRPWRPETLTKFLCHVTISTRHLSETASLTHSSSILEERM